MHVFPNFNNAPPKRDAGYQVPKTRQRERISVPPCLRGPGWPMGLLTYYGPMTCVAALVVAISIALSGVAEAQSTARTVRIPSGQIGLRTIAVLLPAGYDQSEKRYPVLYLLHGGGQDHTAFMARRDFAKRARSVEMIVVMP